MYFRILLNILLFSFRIIQYRFLKLIFIFNIFKLNPIFYLKNRLIQFSRLITNTSVLPSIFIGIITIWVALRMDDNYTEISNNLTLFQLNLYTFIVFVLSGIFGGRYFFKKQTPEQYASFSVDGRNLTDAIRYTSYLIWKECAFITVFSGFIKKYERIADQKGGTGGKTSGISGVIKKSDNILIDLFQNTIEKRLARMEIIEHCVNKLAVNIGISKYRVSDFLFQFNTKIHVDEFRHVVDKMREISLSLDDDSNVGKMRKLKRANYVASYFDVMKKLKKFQDSLIKYRRLHSTLISMSSNYGLSNSLLSYALGFESILKKSKNNKVKQLRAMKFLFHKRRMYPGFDLHLLLANLAKIDIDSSKRILEEDASSKLLRLYDINEENIEEPNNSEINASLKGIVKCLNEHILVQRKEIKSKLLKHVQSKIDINKDKRVVFITQGYSSVVNESLFSVIESMAKNPIYNNIVLQIYILENSSNTDDKSVTKMRYVRYKFKMNPNIKKETSGRVNVKVGNEKWLRRRFKDSKCFLLSGAEFFQVENGSNPKKRHINTETCDDFNEWGLDDVEHIILAEEFKKFDRILVGVYESGLNRDHIEFLNLYDWSSKRTIITGTEIY